MIAEEQVFKNKRIHLDGGSFTNCRFEDCTIVYSGMLGVQLVNPQFQNCRWEFQNAAKETINFMAALYRAGAKDLIEGTFEQIRGNKGAQNNNA